MNWINKMIAALYVQNFATMKFSSEKTIHFIAKLYFSILFPILTYIIVSIYQRLILNINVFIPNLKLVMFSITFFGYLFVDKFTLKTDGIIKFIGDIENDREIKVALWNFRIILFFIFILAISISYYNKWHWIPE
jgi:hypothetical protein